MTLKFFLRLSAFVLTLWCAVSINFLLPRLLPGDPVEFLIGEDASRLSPERRAAVLAQFGLDRPLVVQYGKHLLDLIRLDLGASVGHGRPVSELLLERLPWTLLLVGGGTLMAFAIGFVLASLFHGLPGRTLPALLMGMVMTTGSFPPFWTGLGAIALFAVGLGGFPAFGSIDPGSQGWGGLWSMLHHVALPMATLTLAYLPPVFLVARAALGEALGSGYVALARAHGAGPLRVLIRQAAPNALPPLLNQLAVSLGGLVGGTVVVETVFAYPGLGLLFYEGLLARDFPLLQGAFSLLVVTSVSMSLIADLFQSRLDPRLRMGIGKGI